MLFENSIWKLPSLDIYNKTTKYIFLIFAVDKHKQRNFIQANLDFYGLLRCGRIEDRLLSTDAKRQVMKSSFVNNVKQVI